MRGCRTCRCMRCEATPAAGCSAGGRSGACGGEPSACRPTLQAPVPEDPRRLPGLRRRHLQASPGAHVALQPCRPSIRRLLHATLGSCRCGAWGPPLGRSCAQSAQGLAACLLSKLPPDLPVMPSRAPHFCRAGACMAASWRRDSANGRTCCCLARPPTGRAPTSSQQRMPGLAWVQGRQRQQWRQRLRRRRQPGRQSLALHSCPCASRLQSPSHSRACAPCNASRRKDHICRSVGSVCRQCVSSQI